MTHLYSIELYCPVLPCTVLYCTVLYCTVLYCTVLYCTVLYCTVLYCILIILIVCIKIFNTIIHEYLLPFIFVVREIEVEDALQSNNSIKDLEQSIIDQVLTKLLEGTSKSNCVNWFK